MRKVILLMHVSLDGFVSGPSGELDWIAIDDELQDHVAGLLTSVDTAVYGRVTYQMMESYWPTVPTKPDSTPHEREHSRWVENVQKVVFSRSLDTVTWNNTTLVKDNVEDAVARLKQQPGGDIMIFGSPTLSHTFMQLGLIDQFRLTVTPAVIGSGTPLFQGTPMKLRLLPSKTFQTGVIGLHYEVA